MLSRSLAFSISSSTPLPAGSAFPHNELILCDLLCLVDNQPSFLAFIFSCPSHKVLQMLPTEKTGVNLKILSIHVACFHFRLPLPPVFIKGQVPLASSTLLFTVRRGSVNHVDAGEVVRLLKWLPHKHENPTNHGHPHKKWGKVYICL